VTFRGLSDGAKVSVPPRQILTDGVYEAVKELVMDQHIEPRSRVNIDKLARDLGVSPTPVREALARLESDGLVIKEPLRGYSIAPLLDREAFEDCCSNPTSRAGQESVPTLAWCAICSV